MTTTNKGVAHKAWLDDLRSRPRAEATRLTAEKYPHLPCEEIERRLSLLDAAPATPAKQAPVQLPQDVAEVRKVARKAAMKSGRPARQQHELARKLKAATRKAKRDDAW